MNIISRDWIRNDILFYSGFDFGKCLVERHNKEDFCEFINFWKIKLLKHGAKPGDKLGSIIEAADIHSKAIMFAAFELGVGVVTLNRPTNEKECNTFKSNAFLPLDFFIFTTNIFDPGFFDVAVNHFIKNSKVIISFDQDEWDLRNSFRSKEITPILAKPEDPLLLCYSSGTIGTPKLISHTHKFLYELCNYNWKELGFSDNDHFIHISNLNHGAVLSLLLPALKICKNHYFYIGLVALGSKPDDVNFNNYSKFVNDCLKFNITKVFCTRGDTLEQIINHLINNKIKLPQVEIIFLSFINPKWTKIISEGGLKSITSVFGCSEACGPIFMSQLNSTNTDNFNPKYLGYPTTGFYDTKIVNGQIITKIPEGKEIIFDDIIEEKQDGYYFVKKNRLSKLNDIDINPLDIIEILEKYDSRYTFEIYIDEIYNELIILTSNSTLESKINDIKNDIQRFYLQNINVDVIVYKNLYEATISVKADKSKLKTIIENYRLTKS